MIKIPKYTIIILLLSYQLANANNREVTQNYIAQYGHIAIDEMSRVGIPASIKMAQAILESNSGRSTLARQSNNHFGIKCGKNWKGGEVYREDDDYHNGLLIRSCFRAYDDPAESFYAHSEFIANPYSKRYKFLFELDPYDYKAWAWGLKKAGYATDPKYPSKLIGIIETYRLYELDMGMYPGQNEIAQHKKDSEVQIISDYVIKELSSDQEVMIAQANKKTESKRASNTTNKVMLSKGLYSVRPDDSMPSIAGRYNIPLKKLYVQNRMPFGSEPKLGEKLALDHYIHIKQTPDYYSFDSVDKSDTYLWSETISLALK